MKKISTFVAFVLLSIAAAAAQTMNVSFVFKNVVEGYDHPTHMVVFVDGEKTFTSEQTSERKGGDFNVPLPIGRHKIKVMNEALYNGNWEEHTVSNEYSIDCFWEGELEIGKKTKADLKMVFDIDSQPIIDVKIKKGRSL